MIYSIDHIIFLYYILKIARGNIMIGYIIKNIEYNITQGPKILPVKERLTYEQ